ncbi:hypothetical protein LCGC14_0481790 [marine sediment metagenome]|uniref:Uncharacterized protein n=1 Tax=marine sediment metagenome TaxID=412755 RepID=A0A0F9SEJ3_9ZZZZ
MVKFVDIDPKDIDTSRIGRRGRVSYPILKAFLERNTKVSKLDLTGLDKNPTYLRSVLDAYAKSHKMPIKVFSANGEIHLMRLDLDNECKPIKNWEEALQTTEGAAGLERDLEPVPVSAAEVRRRGKQEKGKTTK